MITAFVIGFSSDIVLFIFTGFGLSCHRQVLLTQHFKIKYNLLFFKQNMKTRDLTNTFSSISSQPQEGR